MPDQSPAKDMMKKATRILNQNWAEQDTTANTINPPFYRGSTVLFANYGEMLASKAGSYQGITYGTDRLPTQRHFEQAMSELEGSAATRIFPSGISAIQAVLLAFTKAGDEVLICDNAYGPGRHFAEKVLSRFAVTITPVAANVGADIEQYISERTSLILLESPGSNTFELQDIPAITQVARAKNIVTALDATWATPLYLSPFNLGIDLTIHSVTKYISGYSDILAGSVGVGERLAGQFCHHYKLMEYYTPAEECYLALRGLHSLAPRLRQHEQSALAIAHWLEDCPLVDQVLHPALPSHPEHHLWQRDFTGSSGLFGFIFKKEYTPEELASFIDRLELFGLGYSWGGYKSLLTASRHRRTTGSRYQGKTIIRLNIGLEDQDDLLADLENGLTMLT